MVSAHDLRNYLLTFQESNNASWHTDPLRAISGHNIPRDFLGPQAWLLEADIKTAWTNWYIDSLINVAAYTHDENKGYAHLYYEIRSALIARYASIPSDELRDVATQLTEISWGIIEQRRRKGRNAIALDLKEKLWFSAEPNPRCYLCGFLFGDTARDKFLSRETGGTLKEIEPPLLVDFTRPRSTSRDQLIEIDHVSSVARGGSSDESNLKLACGWCNKTKGARSSIYDVGTGSLPPILINGLGWVNPPAPFWVLRLVALRGRCEYPGGCRARLENSELVIAPRYTEGSLNPANCAVYCDEHDPWRLVRMIGLIPQRNR
ncbi:HNH endonuclease signature motif containing protein [Rhodococcus ruber]|uniref:HNH endonuclease signature motif containing protein n=1 Tax=Rhodococcus ruber TaxID=1830 RepID=UPI0009ED05A0|nr:HNH endonuclease [Rhodococcus ruber]